MEFIFNENARYEGRIYQKGDKISLSFVPLKMRQYHRDGIVSEVKGNVSRPIVSPVVEQPTDKPVVNVPAPVVEQPKKSNFIEKGKNFFRGKR